MVMHSSGSAAPSAAEVLRARYASRLPASPEKLAGPEHGVVGPPLHVAWSGLRAYDLDRPRLRMGLYRTVLAEGQHEDLVTLLNRDRLAGSDWADDEEFTAYGLTEDETAELRGWAQRWVSDLDQRLHGQDHDRDGEV
ncbi:hypothetical protein ABT237_11125 [Streptomyces sp. NPDC001581]|uniref:hypothetical protein n=1 Tax=Streptomyces sp. NPDC001581 TaxID=3154386 RepID=UPI00332689BD